MRQLRFVAHGEPGTDELVLETADGGERFTLPVDTALRDAVRHDLPRPGIHAAASSEPKLGPRDIQVRVRAGESPQDLAETHGTTLEWVMRFAEPVLAERTRIADEARRAKARRSTTDGEVVVFGEAVDARFAAHGIDPAAVSWDAVRREDGQWVLIARWLGGEDEHTAEWIFHLTSGRTVTPADDTAADLLSDRPIRPVTPPPATEPVLSLAPRPTAGVVAFPAMPDAHTGRLPRAEEVFDQARWQDRPDAPAVAPATAPAPAPEPVHAPAAVARAVPQPAKPAAVPAPAASSAGSSVEVAADEPTDVPLFEEPALPLGIPAPTRIDQPSTRPGRSGRRTPVESDEDKAARAHIPSWDDILLGVRRKQD